MDFMQPSPKLGPGGQPAQPDTTPMPFDPNASPQDQTFMPVQKSPTMLTNANGGLAPYGNGGAQVNGGNGAPAAPVPAKQFNMYSVQGDSDTDECSACNACEQCDGCDPTCKVCHTNCDGNIFEEGCKECAECFGLWDACSNCAGCEAEMIKDCSACKTSAIDPSVQASALGGGMDPALDHVLVFFLLAALAVLGLVLGVWRRRKSKHRDPECRQLVSGCGGYGSVPTTDMDEEIAHTELHCPGAGLGKGNCCDDKS